MQFHDKDEVRTTTRRPQEVAVPRGGVAEKRGWGCRYHSPAGRRSPPVHPARCPAPPRASAASNPAPPPPPPPLLPPTASSYSRPSPLRAPRRSAAYTASRSKPPAAAAAPLQRARRVPQVLAQRPSVGGWADSLAAGPVQPPPELDGVHQILVAIRRVSGGGGITCSWCHPIAQLWAPG